MVKCDKRDGDTIVARFSSHFTSDEHFKKGATALGIDLEQLVFYVDKFEKDEKQNAFDLKALPIDSFSVFLRPLSSPDSDSAELKGQTPLDAFIQALSTQTMPMDSEPIITWKDTKHLAAVDLDVNDGEAIDIINILANFTPCPSLAWVTHGGGLRLIYVSQDIFTAEELAALAIYTLSFMLTYKNIELKKSTRHPGYVKGELTCGEVFQYVQTTDISSLMKFLRRFSVDDKEVQDWLEQQGYAKGSRYPHTKCPVEPSNTGKSDCVLIGEKGIKCYICEAHGVTYGSHKAGFFPYAAFVSNTENTLLYKCVRNFTHFSHARFILSSRFGLTGNFVKLAYSGLLKAVNGVYDSRITDALLRGTDFIRIDNQWMTQSGDVYTKDLKPLLSTLPACQFIKRNGSVSVDNEKLTKFQQTHDLTEYGYTSLTPLWGSKIGSHYLEGECNAKIFAVIQRSIYNSENRHLQPVYSPGNIEHAWTVLEKVFPGLQRNLIRMLIAARGVMELEYGLPPFIYLTGPTGAGKTTHVQIAAGIVGDNVSEIVWTSNIERLREAIATGKQSSSYIAINEMGKESKHKKKSAVEGLDFLLNLTRDSSSWKAYIGPVKLGTLPVMIFTDTGLAAEVKQDKQLARRIIHVELPSSVDWQGSIQRFGISKIQDLRLASKQLADACNVILSSVIDDFFQSPLTFSDVCELLGFKTLTHSEESLDMDNILRLFFNSICDAKALQGADATRWSGKGWKVINKGENKSALLDLWNELADPDFISSRRCEECDWQKVIGGTEPIKMEIRAHGSTRIAVRFRSVTGTKVTYKVNEELK